MSAFVTCHALSCLGQQRLTLNILFILHEKLKISILFFIKSTHLSKNLFNYLNILTQ